MQKPSELVSLGKIMSEGGYKIRNQAAIHFITFAVVEWVDVLTRNDDRDIFRTASGIVKKEKIYKCIAGAS